MRPKISNIPVKMTRNYSHAFTLAELLVCLTIIGVIATFTIPKILQSQQNLTYSSAAKEAVGTVSGAYIAYASLNGFDPNMKESTFLSLINYVSKQTSGLLDNYPGSAPSTIDCSAVTCLKLHNAGVLVIPNSNTYFGGSDSLAALPFVFDPDGVYGGTAQRQSVKFFVYYNGRVLTRQQIFTGTHDNGSTYNPSANSDPIWLTW